MGRLKLSFSRLITTAVAIAIAATTYRSAAETSDTTAHIKSTSAAISVITAPAAALTTSAAAVTTESVAALKTGPVSTTAASEETSQPFEIGKTWRERFAALGVDPSSFFAFFRRVSYTPEEKRQLSARDHFFFGEHYLEMDEYGHALGELHAALEEDPGNVEIMLALAEANKEARQLSAAQQAIDDVLKQDPQNVRALVMRAEIAMLSAEQLSGNGRRDALQQATAALEAAKKVQPRNMEILKTLAATYVAQQDLPKIINAYRDILSVNPRDTYSLLILANVLSKIPGRQEEAIPYYERVIEQRRGFINTYLYLASLYQDLRRDGEAISTYKQALLIEPKNEQVLRAFDQELQKVYGSRGGAPAVLKQYEEFAKEYPYSSEIQRLFGEKLAAAKDYKRAVQQFRHVLELDPENVEALVAVGNAYTQMGDVDEATKYFSKAIDINPDKVEVYEAVATLLNEKNPAKAISIYKKALQLNPNIQKLYLNLANLYDQQGKTADAIQTLEQGLPRVGEKPELLTMLGLLYEKTGDTAKSSTMYEKAFDKAPQNRFLFAKLLSQYIRQDQQDKLGAFLERGQKAFDEKSEFYAVVGETFLAEGQPAKAEEYLQKSLAEDPHRLSTYANLVHVLNLEKQYDRALELTEKARASFGDTESISRMQAETLLMQKNYDAAIDVLRKLVEKKPDSLEGYRLLSDALTKADRPDEAQAVLKQAEAKLGKSDELETMRGIMLFQQKRYEAAERVFRDLAQKEMGQGKDADEYYYFLGSIYLEQKRFDAAEKAFRKAIQLNPRNDNALNALGYMLADQGVRLPEAKKLIEKALEINPSAPHIIDSLGWVEFKMGNTARALELILKAAKIMGDDAEICDHLGDIYAATGDIPKALDYWKKSLTLDQTRVAVKQKISQHQR